MQDLLGIRPDSEYRAKTTWRRWLLLAVLILLFIALVLAFFAIRKVSRAPVLLDAFNQQLASRSGQSIYLVRSIVIVATIPFFIAIVKFIRRVPSFWTGSLAMPKLWLYTNIWGLVIVAYIAAFNYAMYWASETNYPSKSCVQTPEGLKAYDNEGHDPIYGIAMHTCTSEEIIRLRRESLGSLGPKRISDIGDASTFPFFAAGIPLVWYSHASDGSYRFFDGPGNDPLSNEPLHPMDTPTRQAIIQSQQMAYASDVTHKQQSEAAQLINLLPPLPQNGHRVALLVLSGGTDATNEALDKSLASSGFSPVSLFRYRFVSEGRGQKLFDGDWATVEGLGLEHEVNLIILGKMSVTFETSPELENVQTAKLHLELKCLNPKMKMACGSKDVESTGAGFDHNTAIKSSTERAIPQLLEFAKSLPMD